jgi:hypothetical protein
MERRRSFESSSIPHEWNIWIIYPVLGLGLILGVAAWNTFGTKPITEREVRREMDRLSGARSRGPRVFGGIAMTIQYLHASKFGNGAKVAARFKEQMAADGVQVEVHHVRGVRPADLPAADVYVFSSPGRFGKPIRGMRRFLKKVSMSAGSRYAILTTEAMPKPDKKTGRLPTEEELATYQRVRPTMNELLQRKGLVKVGEDTIHVTGLKGPLEDGWEMKVDAFAAALRASLGRTAAAPSRAPQQVA